MAINRENVQHIARLARLRLEPDEVETYQGQLSAILDYVDKLEQLDTADVEPTTHAVPLAMRLREDVVEQRLSRDEVLSNAPDEADGHFRVPKVVEG
mgnify:CR=1 FL=1